MTAKKKATELINQFSSAPDEQGFVSVNKFRHKQCALIAVDEILGDNMCADTDGCNEDPLKFYRDYWNDVRNELEKL